MIDEPVRHIGICSSVCAEGRPGPCSPNRDKHGRRVAASHGYPNWITHVHSARLLWIDRLVESSSSKKKKKKFWFTGQTSSCWIGMRVAQEGTGVPIYIPLRWIFLYHSSYHCTEWVRKQWNQKKNKGNCQSAQPYRFGSDETRRDVHRLRRVTCLDGQRSLRALYQKERKKKKLYARTTRNNFDFYYRYYSKL